MPNVSQAGPRAAVLAASGLGVIGVPLVLAAPALAHHPMEAMGLEPSLLTGLLSGLAHPLLGPDHFVFLLALGLVGLHRPLRWVLGLLAAGLLGSGIGLVLPGLPGAEALVALSLVVTGLVLIQRLPSALLLPAFALHGYVLSGSVFGWESTPIAAYLLGLLLSQSLLMLTALTVVRRWATTLTAANLRLAAGLLMGAGTAFAWSALVA
jgi:urease accessory protein